MNKIILGRAWLLLVTLLSFTVTGYFALYSFILLDNDYSQVHFNNATLSMLGIEYSVFFLSQALIFCAILCFMKLRYYHENILDKFVVSLSCYLAINMSWLLCGLFDLRLIAVILSGLLVMNCLWIFQILAHNKNDLKDNFPTFYNFLNNAFCLGFAWNLMIFLLTINYAIFFSLRMSNVWTTAFCLIILISLNIIGSIALILFKHVLIMASIIFMEFGLLLFCINDHILINFIVIAIILNCLILYLSKSSNRKFKTLLETEFNE
ncbi:hypothetical protein AAEX28_08615 [Lentisphaerota bacterium WC36G]|nr:hypothetical protein LJT99_11470 [Lentisphaerae bacterium WC36]